LPTLSAPIASMVVIFLPTVAEIGVTHARVATPSKVERARSAERHAASELGAGHAEYVAQGP